MIGEGHAAAGALIGKAAIAAANELVCPPAVKEEDTLLPRVQVFLQLLRQHGTDAASVSLPKFPLHVHNADTGQLLGVVALIQTKIGIAPDLRLIAAHQFRSCGAEKKGAAGLAADILGDVSGMIAGSVFGTISLLLLLVDDQDPQVLNRRKDGASGPDDQMGTTGSDTFPFVIALSQRKRAVQNGDLVSKMIGKGAKHLGRQSNFRYQKNRGLAAGELLLDQMDINAGLPAAGDSLQKGAAGFAAGAQSRELLKNRLLLLI